MRLLQRYILAELLKVFVFLLCVLTILLVFVGVLREVSESGLGPLQVLKVLPFIVPSMLPFTIPATLLLSVCVVYGRLSGDQEVTAAKAAGINVLSLVWPAFLLSLVLCISSLVLTDRVIPWAVANMQRIITQAMEDIFIDMLHTHHQVQDDDRGFSISVMDMEGKRLIKPIFQYSRPGHGTVTVQADSATVEFDLEAHEVVLHLVRANVDAPGRRRVYADRADRPFPMPEEISKPKPRHMSIRTINKSLAEFRRELDAFDEERSVEAVFSLTLGDFDDFSTQDSVMENRNRGYQIAKLAKLRTEIHSRFAMSTSCFFFVLLGAPFSIMQGRRQFLTSFFLCFMPILLIYYPIVMLMLNLCKNGVVEPSYGMWTGNVILFVCGFFTLRKVMKH